MSDVPDDWKERLRELCLPPGRMDPAGGTMYRWSHHDGSTWAYVAFEGPVVHPYFIQGWAAITFEEEPEPVLGVFVAPEHRGKGLARTLVTGTLELARAQITEYGGEVIAVSTRYPAYKTLIESAGFTHKDWE